MVNLTIENYQHILTEHLKKAAQADLLNADADVIRKIRNRRRDPLHIWLPRRLFRYLGRLKSVVTRRGKQEFWIPNSRVPVLEFSEELSAAEAKLDIAVHMHVYFIDLLPELIVQTQNIYQSFTCYATTDSEEKAEAIKALLSMHPLINTFRVIVAPNRGRDIAPWIIEMARYNDRHELWCHIHTKKSLHVPKLGDSWRRFLLQQVLGSKSQVRNILSSFSRECDLGLVIPPFYKPAVGRVFSKWDELDRAKIFFKKLNISSLPPRNPIFAAGSMFWYRPQALAALFDQNYCYEDFELETNQLGGTLAHLIERSLVYIATNKTFSFKVAIPANHLETT